MNYILVERFGCAVWQGGLARSNERRSTDWPPVELLAYRLKPVTKSALFKVVNVYNVQKLPVTSDPIYQSDGI